MNDKNDYRDNPEYKAVMAEVARLFSIRVGAACVIKPLSTADRKKTAANDSCTAKHDDPSPGDLLSNPSHWRAKSSAKMHALHSVLVILCKRSEQTLNPLKPAC